jgi:hypothetical protein
MSDPVKAGNMKIQKLLTAHVLLIGLATGNGMGTARNQSREPHQPSSALHGLQ